ncbi:MAG: hypothetical protein ABEH90_00355, partial [Halolamina sp.]
MRGDIGRRGVLAALGAAAFAGCLGGDRTPTERKADATAGTEVAGGTATGTDANGPPTAEQRLPLPMEASALREEAVSGGPPKDGIPSIDGPQFIASEEAPDGLKPGDPVFGVVM